MYLPFFDLQYGDESGQMKQVWDDFLSGMWAVGRVGVGAPERNLPIQTAYTYETTEYRKVQEILPHVPDGDALIAAEISWDRSAPRRVFL